MGGRSLGLMGTDRTVTFHRMYGDINGDRAVNNTDLAAFRSTFGLVSPDPELPGPPLRAAAARRDAISPACAPPIPSATAKSGGSQT